MRNQISPQAHSLDSSQSIPTSVNLPNNVTSIPSETTTIVELSNEVLAQLLKSGLLANAIPGILNKSTGTIHLFGHAVQNQ